MLPYKNSNTTDETYRLADLIDLDAIQRMADSHFKATGMPIGLIDAFDNSILVGAGWQDICVYFHRANPETLKRCKKSDNFIKANLSENNSSQYKCLNGLWDIGMPIFVSNQHLATLFLGQFFYEGEIPDRQFFINQASQYSFNQEAYLCALDRVPIFPRDKVRTILEYDTVLAGFIADLAEKAQLQKQGAAERAKLEARLQQVQKMDSIGQLVGGVAHDFNNMLGGIMGATEVLALYLPDDPEAKKIHQMILDTVGRAADLVDKILTFSRSTPQTLSVVDVAEIIKETIVLLKNTIDRRINLEVDLAANSATVVGDPSQLQNTFLNLGINSSHAMSEGGTLRISTQNLELDAPYCNASPFNLHPGKYLEIEIHDTGCGIPPKHLNKIFDPYFTTKEQGQGTGLGLAAVYANVQQHNGSIIVYSEPGSGTTFQMLLPLASKGQIIEIASPPIIKGSGRILVVDDDEVMRTIAQAILEDLGYDVILAEDGQQALTIFREKTGEIDLVLLDMMMPVMNGCDCFNAMKRHDPEVRVILSSGLTREVNDLEMKLDGLKGVLRKPYLRANLSQIVHEALKTVC